MSKGQTASKSKKSATKSGTKTRKPVKEHNGLFKPGNTIGMETRIKPGEMLASKYDESYPASLLDFFENPTQPLPTTSSWAKQNRICIETMEHWAADEEKYPLFSKVFKQCKRMQEDALVIGGAVGTLNSNVVKFLLSAQHGMSEKKTTDNTVTFAVRVSEEIDEESN